MSFEREKIRDIYLLTTEVENIFINEYLPAAPGDFVKIYLYALLYSESGGRMDEEQMSRQLGVSRECIEEAWAYWQSMGVVERRPAGPGKDAAVIFRQLRAQMYGSQAGEAGRSQAERNYPAAEGAEREAAQDSDLASERLRELLAGMERLLGKPLSPKETREIFSWVEELRASDEVIIAAASYCVEKGKTSVNYIAKVVAQWAADGLETEEDVRAYLDGIEERQDIQKKILQSLGLNRAATALEKQMINRWFDELHFNLDRVMDACARASFIAVPNLKYVNKVLENWYEEAKSTGRDVNNTATASREVLNRYYAYLRDRAAQEAEERKKEVYGRIPRIKEIDEEMMALGKKLSRILLKGSRQEIDELKRLLSLLEEERAVLLTENNYREDYTDIKYTCDKCSDTGITADGARCDCVRERIGEAEVWQNSTSSKS